MQLYYTLRQKDSAKFLNKLLTTKFNIAEYTMHTGAYGKKYILLPNGRSPIQFSITHSKNLLAIAFDSLPIGIDAECIYRKIPQSILQSFSMQEQQACKTNTDFFKNWTAKESYIKLCGKSLLQEIKKLVYIENTLYNNNQMIECNLQFTTLKSQTDVYIIAICSNSPIADFTLIEEID